jgi:hypothetical protein
LLHTVDAGLLSHSAARTQMRGVDRMPVVTVLGSHHAEAPTTRSPCRLEELPAMPLQEVARKAGWPARLISKLLLEAYGQLRCGLRLEYYTLAELLHILQQQCGRLGGITSLELASIMDAEQQELLTFANWLQQGTQQQLQELIAAIPAALPNVQSLDLFTKSYQVACASADVALLAPLGSCLTALKLRLTAAEHRDLVASPALPHFTRLQHLTIGFLYWMSEEQVDRCLESLASMPALVHLNLSGPLAPISAALWLPGLARATPQLTALTFQSTHQWDDSAMSALQRGLPALQALSIALDDCEEADEQHLLLGDILTALAGRKGLTSLALGCTLRAWELPQPVPSNLQITDLTLELDYHAGQQTVQWLLDALPSQTGLTSLTIRLPSAGIGAAEAFHHSLLTVPSTLVRLNLGCDYPGFDAASVMEGIVRQPRLQELSLEASDMMALPQEAALKLALMTQLQVLELVYCRFQSGFMQAIAALTELRYLNLTDEWYPAASHLTGPSLLCLHPLQRLTRLRLQLSTHVVCRGLVVVRQLGALQELEIVAKQEVVQRLHLWLLPLPAKLSKLDMRCTEYVEVSDTLINAAKLRGCTVFVRGLDKERVHLP